MHFREIKEINFYKDSIEGKTITFNKVEQINRDTNFKVLESIKMDEIKNLNDFLKNGIMLFNHDSSKVLGQVGANLNYSIKNDGLYFKLDRIKTALHDEIFMQIENGFKFGCSFGFNGKEEVTEFGQDFIKQELRDVNLFETTITIFPAYQSTYVNARNDKDITTIGQIKMLIEKYKCQ